MSGDIIAVTGYELKEYLIERKKEYLYETSINSIVVQKKAVGHYKIYVRAFIDEDGKPRVYSDWTESTGQSAQIKIGDDYINHPWIIYKRISAPTF